MTATTSYREFTEEQIRFCETKDYDGIASHYTEDAALIRHDGQIYGRDAIREYFIGYLAGLPGMKVTSMDQYTETADSVMFEGTISLDAGTARVYDVFVMRDGKIFRHYAGLLSFTPKA